MAVRKWGVMLIAAVMLSAIPMQGNAAVAGRGGVPGFFVGCCFGVRTAGQYNAGKNIHFRDWGRLIPYVGAVFAIWDGIDGAQNTTTQSLQEQYGAQYF